MSYESGNMYPSNTMGKRYGARGVGGVLGEYPQTGGEREIQFDIDAGEPMTAAYLTKELPAGFLVTSVYYQIDTVFATSSAMTFSIGGGTSSTSWVMTSKTAAKVGITTMGTLSHVDAKDFVITVTSQGQASAAGKAQVIVKYVLI